MKYRLIAFAVLVVIGLGVFVATGGFEEKSAPKSRSRSSAPADDAFSNFSMK